MKKQLLLFTLLLNALLSFGQVPTTERDALIALYNATDGANWTNNTNWNTTQPVSTWFGITVENISGQDHVTEISFGTMTSNNLNGQLPAEIGNLTELTNLDIEYNDLLTGNIPTQIGNLSNLTELSLWNNNFTGSIPSELGNCTSLTTMSLEDNQLTGNIPTSFSNLTNMASFWVNGNQLSGDIPDIFSNWTALYFFSIGNGNGTTGAHNDFTGSLDLSNNNALRLCWVDNTLISSLNIKNGNNTNFSYNSYFDSRNTPNLTCVFVDDASYSTTNWTNIDATGTFVETQAACDALFTSILDDNFEQALIDLGHDDILDDKVRTANIETLTSLVIRNKNINDLTGINDFVALTYLNIGNNNISAIDLSDNVNLTGLYCYDNNLTSLNLDTNINLTVVNCSENNLTTLDLSNNTALTRFYCALNNLTTLDFSSNNSIEKLWCYDNNLTTLNVKNGANNLLSGTYESGGITYSRFRAANNPNLTCIFVDNATDANNFVGNYLNWEIDTTATFVETQAACDALDVSEETLNQSIVIYPNPTTGILNIRNNTIVIKQITILNTLGQQVLKRAAVSNLDISNLPNGIYYVNFESVEGLKTSYKVIKE